MHDIGIVRKLDELGRITLPMELRKNFDLEVCDSLHIYVDGDRIVLEKFEPRDIFTGETQGLISYQGKNISVKTIKELVKLAGLSDDDIR